MEGSSEQPGASRPGDRKTPPPKTRLYWASLTNAEKSVLDAMYEHCSDGSIVWAALPRLAAYSKLSRKTVQRALHGDHRKGRQHTLGLIGRGIVTQLAPANRGKKRPATYRINADALAEDPQMERYKSRQQVLPGIRRTAVPGEPIESCSTTDPRSIVPATNYGPRVQGTTVPGSTNSLDSDSLLKSKAIQHGDAALQAAPRCPLCDGSGWRPLTLSNRDRAVTRCSCWRPKQPAAAAPDDLQHSSNNQHLSNSHNQEVIDRKSAAAGERS